MTPKANVMTKTVRLSDEVSPDEFYIKFSSTPSKELLSGFLKDYAIEVEPVFTRFEGKEALEAQFGLDRWYSLKLKDGALLEKAIEYSCSLESVSLVEYCCSACKDEASSALYSSVQTKAKASAFNDPLLGDQWHYSNDGGALYGTNAVAGADVNVKDVWGLLKEGGDPEIVVAVVDEGVKYTHPDLRDNMWTNSGEIPGNGIDDDGNGFVDDVYGYNFADDGPITWALEGDSGHATHCAGTIAAVSNNGIGVSGVAGGTGNGDGCRIMSCQIFSGLGGGTTSQTAKAIKYAADMGASIISCSFGYTNSFASDNAYVRSQGSMEIDAIHYFEASRNNDVLDGGIAIFAAGNEGAGFAHYPGAFYDVISVSAIGSDMLPTYYTNYGPGCNIAAPGGELGAAPTFKSMILSTVPSELSQKFDSKDAKGFDYGYMQGTSMACPHVSGVAALGLSYAKRLGKTFSAEQFKNMLLSSTNDIDMRISSAQGKKYQNVTVDGNKYYKAHADLEITPYYHLMGTGAVDAWQLMMQIEGIPSVIVRKGEKQWIDLSPYFGTSSVSLSYLDVTVAEETIESLGLEKISPSGSGKNPAVGNSGYAYVQFGRLYIHPSKVGSGKIRITCIGGGDHIGGGDNAPGGMTLDREISVISRPFKSKNGGWM